MFKSKSQEYIEVKLSPQFCDDTKDNQLKHLVNCFAYICMTFRLMPYDVFLSVFYPEELQNPLAVNTDNKTADSVGVVTSEGDALLNLINNLSYDYFDLSFPRFAFARDFLEFDENVVNIQKFLEICFSHDYQDFPLPRSQTFFTDSEIQALLIMVNTEIDLNETDEQYFDYDLLKSIQKKLFLIDSVKG